MLISIHAPREGSDTIGSGEVYTIYRISIHAPREGSDRMIFFPLWISISYFYPRSPRGERQC